MAAEQFTDEQREVWETYAPARAEALASGRPHAVAEVVGGFAYVCQLEGVTPPPDGVIRAAISAEND